MNMQDIAPLGFGIPTYRRPELLDRAIQSIVEQVRDTSTPIYISDNSCDETNKAVVGKWLRTHANIIHQVNEVNVGIDRNVERAIERCPATYVHVIGDDDIIFPGFVTRVMQAIHGAPPHVICSYLYLLNDYRITTGIPIIPTYGEKTSLRTFLPRHGWTLGFIGAHVFNRALFSAGTASGYGSYFHHIIRLVGYLEPDEPVGFVAEALVGNRVDDESTPSWSADRLNVVFGLEKALVGAMAGRYKAEEVARTVEATRKFLGYTQFFRLLYWAALAEKTGNGERYWQDLKGLIEPIRYRRLRSMPRFLDESLTSLIPHVRRLKRSIRRSGPRHP